MVASAADKVLTMNYRPMTADLLLFWFILSRIDSFTPSRLHNLGITDFTFQRFDTGKNK